MPARRLDEYFKRLGREARRGDVDLEALMRELVALAVEEALQRAPVQRDPACGGAEGGGLEALRREIEGLRSAVERLAERVEALEKAITSLGGQAAGRREPEWVRRLKAVAERMGGVVPLSISGVRLDESKTGVLENYGLLFVRGQRDAYIMTLDSALEFLRLLDETSTPDDEEAASKMGRFGDLFRDLRRAGLIIYSSRRRRWVPQDELKAYRDRYMGKT